ncbi:MAG: adenosylhomocysteinase [Thermoproteota archaeon]
MEKTGDLSAGLKKINWAETYMPVLSIIKQDFLERKPLKKIRISATLHVTKETAALIKTLSTGGAEVFLTPSNPLSTDNDVAAALREIGVHVMAWRGMSNEEYFSAIDWALSQKPNIIIDDGADAIVSYHEKSEAFQVFGALEETTTGVRRVKALEEKKALRFTVIAVNNAKTKWLFDNRYGTGQSALDGIMRATQILFAGKCVVVAGYGMVGRGIANRARGLGSKVIVTEVDPIRALEAVMDGYEVMPMLEAARRGDVFITATGNKNVIDINHFEVMKQGAILANAGHFDVEINVKALYAIASNVREINSCTEEITLKNGKKVYLLAKGRLVNLVCASGHPSEVMDMSFSNQALCTEFLVNTQPKEKKLIEVPEEIDKKVAWLKLKAFGVEIDKLSYEQEEYLASW